MSALVFDYRWNSGQYIVIVYSNTVVYAQDNLPIDALDFFDRFIYRQIGDISHLFCIFPRVI